MLVVTGTGIRITTPIKLNHRDTETQRSQEDKGPLQHHSMPFPYLFSHLICSVFCLLCVSVPLWFNPSSQRAAPGLLALDRLEQRLEIPLAEAAGAVAFDHLEKQRRPVFHRFRENLQQITFV